MNPTDEAAKALEDFANGPALSAANETAKLFEAAGERIAKSLENAARRGELSFNSLAENVARDLARLAVAELITSPLQNAVSGIGGALLGGLSGGAGGNSGGGSGKTPVTVNMTVSGVSDPASFARSQNQISTTLARAVSAGQRYI
jgi:lambda family phage tail tape measure protein